MIYPRYTALKSDNAFGWLHDEAAKAGIDLTILFIEDLDIVYGSNTARLLHCGHEISYLPRFAIMRTYDTIVSRYFQRLGIPVINSAESMEICKDKMLTHERLVTAGLPTPLTAYRTGGEYDYEELTGLFLSPAFIVKRIDGAKGEDVYLINSRDEMERAVQRCSGRCICQQFVDTSRGRDIRVWVIGGYVAGAVLRHSETSFLSNYSQGGGVSALELPDQAASLAIQGAAATGTEFAGIDLLFTRDGFTINEVNGNAGFRTLSRVADNCIPSQLFAYIRERYL